MDTFLGKVKWDPWSGSLLDTLETALKLSKNGQTPLLWPISFVGDHIETRRSLISNYKKNLKK